LDGITNVVLKLEREKRTKMLIELMKLSWIQDFVRLNGKMQESYCYIRKEIEKIQEIGDQLQLRMLFAKQ
jgi:hypothetical protein